MPDLEAIIFDLYDTLVWSDWPRHAAMLADHLGVSVEEVFSAYEHLREERDGGSHLDAETVLAAVMDYCGVESTRERVAHLADLEADLLSEHVGLFDDSLPVLRRLRSDGLRTGVISNCSPSTRPVVDRLGLEAETGVVILSCEVGCSKPSPAIFRAALDALGVSADRSMFVDDLSEYLDGAASLGMRTVQIRRFEHEPARSGRPPEVGNLYQVLELVG